MGHIHQLKALWIGYLNQLITQPNEQDLRRHEQSIRDWAPPQEDKLDQAYKFLLPKLIQSTSFTLENLGALQTRLPRLPRLPLDIQPHLQSILSALIQKKK